MHVAASFRTQSFSVHRVPVYVILSKNVAVLVVVPHVSVGDVVGIILPLQVVQVEANINTSGEPVSTTKEYDVSELPTYSGAV